MRAVCIAYTRDETHLNTEQLVTTGYVPFRRWVIPSAGEQPHFLDRA
jgi:hypothetical protein